MGNNLRDATITQCEEAEMLKASIFQGEEKNKLAKKSLAMMGEDCYTYREWNWHLYPLKDTTQNKRVKKQASCHSIKKKTYIYN